MYFKRLVSLQMHTNRVFNGLRLIENTGGGGVLLENLGGGVRPASLTLFTTKLCDIDPYPYL